MAEYNVTSPDGQKYKVSGPDGATDEQVLAQVKAYKPAGASPVAAPTPTPAKPAAAPPAPAKQPGMGDFVGGNLNKFVAGFAGTLPGAATDLANLGIAGYGAARGAITGRPQDSPNLINKQNVPGTAPNLENLFRSIGAIKPGAEPESAGGRYAAAAIQGAPAMLMGRPQGAWQALRGATAGATSGMAGELGADIGGEEYRGAASMLPGARTMQEKSPGARATAARQADVFGKAKEKGIPIPPRLLKEDKPQQVAQNEANKHMGQPEGTEITPETIKQYNKSYLPDYLAAFKSPPLAKGLTPTPTFQAEIRRLQEEIGGSTREMPKTFKGLKEAVDLLNEYDPQPKGQFAGVKLPPGQGVPIKAANVQRAIRTMREGASANFAAGGENNVQLARAQKGIANALENLVEENLQISKQPDLMAKFREARTQMAKGHDVLDSLDPKTNRVDPMKFSQMVNDGRQISGGLKDYANIASTFPQAVQSPTNTQASNEKFTGRVSPMAITHPPAIGLHWATRIADPITMSRPYQSAVVDPRNKITPEQERMIRAIIAAQGANRGIPQPPQ